jgi:2,3-bisphosphoglycerate-independent phosphoglycerate mutase
MATEQGPATSSTPVVLIVLDGWGLGRDEPGNAVLAARTPAMDRLWTDYPHATLRCSGEDVGLPPGQMGNSEVGHLNLGAGRVVFQWLTRIDRAIADDQLPGMPPLRAIANDLRASGGTLHLLGLVSHGGVHSHIRHLVALLQWARSAGIPRVAVHAFTDGRDTSPTSGLLSIAELEAAMDTIGVGCIATLSGRYYAMDRDHRWDRTELAFAAIASGTGPRFASANEVLIQSYAAGITDEFILPTAIGEPSPPADGDALLFFNFRSDRMRQLVAAFATPAFQAFPRPSLPENLTIATMARYEESLPVQVIFPSEDIASPIAGLLSDAGFAQMHVAETEKYAHVTFFFNGGREAPFAREGRSMVPSPHVATYDLLPEMSASAVADTVAEANASRQYAFTIVNFANCDMVGHTGNFDAAVTAVETVDRCLERVVDVTLANGGVALVTADHGNAEEMIDRDTGKPMTAHTTNPVPVILVTPDDHPARHRPLRVDGRLPAVAPTLLNLLGLPVPEEMNEPSLLTMPDDAGGDHDGPVSAGAVEPLR